MGKTERTYKCAACGRRLKEGRWVYSRHTGQRFCWPGEGCQKVTSRVRPS